MNEVMGGIFVASAKQRKGSLSVGERREKGGRRGGIASFL